MRKVLILSTVVLLLIAGCKASGKVTVKERRGKGENIKIPIWFNNIPSNGNFLFAVATARSTHADFAIKKGLQSVYVEMSRVVQSQLHGIVLHLVEEYGDVYYDELNSISELISSNIIGGIRIINQEVVKEGTYYRTYFLAALPRNYVFKGMRNNLRELGKTGKKMAGSSLLAVHEPKKKNDNFVEVSYSRKKIKKYYYPAWFLKSGKYLSGDYVIGYAEKAFHEENAINNAFENGIWNYLYFNRNRITGTMRSILDKEQDFSAEHSVVETVDTSSFSYILEQEVPRDTAKTKNMYLLLLGGEMKENASSMIRLEKMPSWIVQLPEEKGKAYAVGMAPIYQHETSSWLEAEKDARKKLALMYFSLISTVSQMRGGVYAEANSIKINAEIKNAKIVARARNKYMVFVLIKMPLNLGR